MARRLAALLCASSLAFFQPALAGAEKPRLLTQQQLEEPALVSAWLKQHAGRADQRRAAAAYDLGVQEARRASWGSAVKAYGESAIRLPSPRALNAYADATARFLGALREHKQDRAGHLEQDLRSVEALYRSALASDSVLAAMSAQERLRTVANADCLAVYRRDRSGLGRCAPLRAYGLHK